MTDQAMQRARELAAAEAPYADDKAYFASGIMDSHPAMIALTKHLREVSDALDAYFGPNQMHLDFQQFILPPAKSDPVDALADALNERVFNQNDNIREALRSELELAGLELREVGK